MRKPFDWLALAAIVAAHFAALATAIALAMPRNSDGPTANDLILDGFKILDPDGFEIERFDTDGRGGWDYWTTEPKTHEQIGDRTT